MIHVEEKALDKNTILIDVGGVLDIAALPVLEEVCYRHLSSGKKVLLNLEAVVHITREGRAFIQAIQPKVGMTNLPEFMTMSEGS